MVWNGGEKAVILLTTIDRQTRQCLVFPFLLFGDDCGMPSKKPAPCPLRSRFGKNVAAMRIAAGITQEQLAEKVALSTRYLQSVEAGEYFPPLATLARLKAVLNCTWEELFEGV